MRREGGEQSSPSSSSSSSSETGLGSATVRGKVRDGPVFGNMVAGSAKVVCPVPKKSHVALVEGEDAPLAEGPDCLHGLLGDGTRSRRGRCCQSRSPDGKRGRRKPRRRGLRRGVEYDVWCEIASGLGNFEQRDSEEDVE